MLRLQNSMTRTVETFEPKNGKTVKMFTCGPSIYQRPHIGNYRTFLWEDALQRYLEYLGYNVHRVINFTDVEDKSIEEAEKRGESVTDLTEAVARRFMEETGRLKIKLPEVIPRSSTSVEDAAAVIRTLLDKGVAYWHDGDVFFDPLKFPGFGRLYGLDMSRWPKEKRRFKRDTYPGQRWNLGDFILWHGYRKGESVYFDSEIGRGRPSWNIQDPAIISRQLGFSIDIFCGGIDNKVRHHDYNIAVMESASGEELARYWLHGEHVLVRGKKMSKSLNNVVYPEDLLGMGLSWEQIRFCLLQKPYRKRLNATRDYLLRLGARYDAFRERLSGLLGASRAQGSGDEALRGLAHELTAGFEAGMDDDLNTEAAFENVFETVSKLRDLAVVGRIGSKDWEDIEKRLRKIDRVFQVISYTNELSR
ncbi:MAG: class I tRNA ligase family protein [Desulfobacteraceae bacterium]|nr:class I tRNA ligase family protein [Desulfobacteraceae bacterium]